MAKLTLLFLLAPCLLANGQGSPTLDKLLELKWKGEGTEYSLNPLIHDGLIFETFGLEYAWDAVKGEKRFFHNKDIQMKIRQLTRDSIILFSSKAGTAIVNIYNGDLLFRSNNNVRRPGLTSPWGLPTS